jgi:predicted PurR-regulated permease PerM
MGKVLIDSGAANFTMMRMSIPIVPSEPPGQPAPPLPAHRRLVVRRPVATPGSWWWSATALAMAIILGFGTLVLIWLFARPMALIILGVSLAAALAPPVDWLGHRFSRTVCILIVYALILLAFAGVFAIIIPPMLGQIQALVTRAPLLIQDAQRFLDQSPIFSNSTISSAVLGEVGRIGAGLVTAPIMLASNTVDLALVVVISAYWLAVAPVMRSFFLSLFPQARQTRINRILAELGIGMGGYIRGTFITGVIQGIAAYIGLLLIGVNYPLVLGTFTGVMEFIPYLGPFLSGALMVGIALSQSVTLALIVLVFAIVLQEVEAHLIIPLVMRSQTDISPLLAVIALFAGASVGGLIGALTAIPLAVALRVIVRRVIAPAIRRQTGAAEE